MSEIRQKTGSDFGKSTLEDFVSAPPRWHVYHPVGTPDSIAGEMAEMVQESRRCGTGGGDAALGRTHHRDAQTHPDPVSTNDD